MNAGNVLRAARHVRQLSQRELAAHAGVPRSTIDRIESGRADPRLSTLSAILGAVGYRLVITTAFGRPLRLDDESADLRDEADRRFPAHLPVAPVIGEAQDAWWGWRRIAWLPDDPGVPEFSYARRRRAWQDPYYADRRWNDAT